MNGVDLRLVALGQDETATALHKWTVTRSEQSMHVVCVEHEKGGGRCLLDIVPLEVFGVKGWMPPEQFRPTARVVAVVVMATIMAAPTRRGPPSS